MASATDNTRWPQDQAFKAIFSYARMIEDALRGYAVRPRGPLHPRTVAALDFSTLERLPSEWIGEGFRRRQGDQAWRVCFRWARDWSDPGGYLLILVEFQSGPDPGMASRMAGYAAALYRELETAGVVRPAGPRPPVFPLVIHNGQRRWRAATELSALVAAPALPAGAVAPEDAEDARRAAQDLAAFQLRHAYYPLDFERYREDDLLVGNAVSVLMGLEGARSEAELLAPLGMLPELGDPNLARTMLDWALWRQGIAGAKAEELKTMASLDNFHSRLEENVKIWAEERRAEGRAEGVEQGLAEGMERGMERGLAEGLVSQRIALKRQAALRFGAPAQVLEPLLERIDSPTRLADVSEWLIVDTLDELVAKVRAAAADRTH